MAKAANSQVWQKVLPFCGELGFAWDVEVIATARMLAIPVQEIGVEWHHREGSRLNVLRDGVRMVRLPGPISSAWMGESAIEKIPPPLARCGLARSSGFPGIGFVSW